MTLESPYEPGLLPDGVRSHHVDNGNGLRMHVLEAGDRRRPALLLLHGFPELAYSWRKILPVLADAGWHAIAPDLRGYGRTLGWGPVDYDSPLDQFRMMNKVRDALGLLAACGHDSAAAVIGHDYGSAVAAWSALIRPDVFRSCILMSAPFDGPPPLRRPPPHGLPDVHSELAALERPRKHYQWYYSTRAANGHMTGAPDGIHAFLRAYYHHKSADWLDNRPYRLEAWRADQLALMPTYYIMDLAETMPSTVAAEMPDAAEIARATWLTDEELSVYAAEYTRTGFQGGLNLYRRGTTGFDIDELRTFAGRTIDQPSCFIAGRSDWGIHQRPGSLERMNGEACTAMTGVFLIEGAGHWVQQEQPEETARLIREFLADAGVSARRTGS